MPQQSAETTITGNKKKRRPSSARRQVSVTYETHRLLIPAADGLQISASEYASAAIRYFAERGLNPVTNHEREGAVIQRRIGDLEKLVVTLGDRLFGWLTQHEKNLNKDLFGYLRGHEKANFEYQKNQTLSVHQHLNDLEDSFLGPLMREAILGSVESFFARRITEQIMLKVSGFDVKKEYSARHEELNNKRDVRVEEKITEFLMAMAPTHSEQLDVPAATPVPERKSAPRKVESTPSTAASKSLSDGLPDSF